MTTGKDPRPSPYGWETALAWCPPEESAALGIPATATPFEKEQAKVTLRYDRTAWLNDAYDGPRIRSRRRRLLSQARGRVLEAGVGSGHNLAFYPANVDLTAIDVSSQMLIRARRRADELGRGVALEQADVTALPYPDDAFDTAVATSVFCSVPDPVAGLTELGRVTKPDGRILLLEHVRPRNRFLGWLADLATVVTRRLFGFRANRRTEDNIAAAGLGVIDIRSEGIWREIVARPDAEVQAAPSTVSVAENPLDLPVDRKAYGECEDQRWRLDVR